MTKTRLKLEEAEYFLNQMHSNKDTDKIFIFVLNAFLSAARSVTFIMQSEFSDRKNFRSWYITKQDSMFHDKNFCFFNKLRRMTVHHESIIPNKNVVVYILEPLRITSDTPPYASVSTTNNAVCIALPESQGKLQPLPEVQASSSYSWCFKERPNEDVLTLCNDYILNLKELVNDCENNFI